VRRRGGETLESKTPSREAVIARVQKIYEAMIEVGNKTVLPGDDLISELDKKRKVDGLLILIQYKNGASGLFAYGSINLPLAFQHFKGFIKDSLAGRVRGGRLDWEKR